MRRNTRKHVEEALLKRALGFFYEETRTESGSDGKEKTVVTEKYAEPDVRSIIYWLTNRHPKQWKVKPEDEPAGFMGPLIQLVDGNRKAAERDIQ